MKTLVTGGTGFLGRAVVESLLAGGHAVRVLVRDPRVRLAEGAERAVGDLGATEGLEAALEGVDAVLHLAGMVSRDPKDASAMHEIHVQGTKRLLDAMEARAVRRLVLASTSGTIAVSKTARIATEAHDAPLEIIGRWPYYMSKRLEEKEVLSRDAKDRIEAVVLNPSLLLGPGDERGSSSGDVLKILHRRLPALTEGTVALVDVRDVAPAFVAALERGRRGQRYLLNGANMSVRSFVERVALAGDVGAPKLRLPERWAKASARLIEGVYEVVDRVPPIDAVSVEMGCHHWGCSSKKASTELGFVARDPGETIHETVRDLARRGLFRR